MTAMSAICSKRLPALSLTRLYLLYPDPWPKVRHHKRRLVNPETLAEFHRLLRPGGHFIFASDIADYVDWTRTHIAAAWRLADRLRQRRGARRLGRDAL